MNNFKKICDLSWCKIHSKCIFHNAESSLKTLAHEVALGNNINADIIVCYRKEGNLSSNNDRYLISSKIGNDLEREIFEPKPKRDQIHCESPNCNSAADVRLNDKFHFCYNCLDLLRRWKTNHELATYFNQRHRIIKLLKIINELENPNKQKEVIRCTNIYCGTTENITRHHLIPKAYRKDVVGKNAAIPLCESCHKRVHRLKSNGQLAKYYNTKSTIITLLSEDVSYRVMRVLNVESEMELMAVA